MQKQANIATMNSSQAKQSVFLNGLCLVDSRFPFSFFCMFTILFADKSMPHQ